MKQIMKTTLASLILISSQSVKANAEDISLDQKRQAVVVQ